MDFNDYGFKSGDIVLPGLDITARIIKPKYFRNDGFVEDIAKHTEKVLKEINYSGVIVQTDFKNNGKHIFFTNDDDKASLIYYTDGGAKTNTFTQGYISTKAIINLGLNKHLNNLLLENGFKMDPFMLWTDADSIANIGGLVSLYINKMNNEVLFPSKIKKQYEQLMFSRK